LTMAFSEEEEGGDIEEMEGWKFHVCNGVVFCLLFLSSLEIKIMH
jgi:hypothetical protein